MLLLHANHVVSLDRILEALWDLNPVGARKLVVGAELQVRQEATWPR